MISLLRSSARGYTRATADTGALPDTYGDQGTEPVVEKEKEQGKIETDLLLVVGATAMLTFVLWALDRLFATNPCDCTYAWYLQHVIEPAVTSVLRQLW